MAQPGKPDRAPCAFIFVNGRLPSLKAARAMLQPEDWLVAADGGARHLAKLGLTPHLVVGDMDSLSAADLERLEQAGVKLLRFPRQKDETDLELALQVVIKGGWRRVRIIGALGGRFDQMLANLALLTQPLPEGVDLRLDDGVEEAFIIRSQAQVEGKRGDVVSLLPQGGSVGGVVTEGLRYPLNGETLYAHRTRGVSNEMLVEIASVRIASGALVCVHRRKQVNSHVRT